MAGRERKLQAVSAASGGDAGDATVEELLALVARGDDAAFARLYDVVVGRVFSLVRRVVRDHAQSEEVTQEVLVEVWRTAARFDPGRGSASAWVMTMAHRRAVDRVRSAQAASRGNRPPGAHHRYGWCERAAPPSWPHTPSRP